MLAADLSVRFDVSSAPENQAESVGHIVDAPFAAWVGPAVAVTVDLTVKTKMPLLQTLLAS